MNPALSHRCILLASLATTLALSVGCAPSAMRAQGLGYRPPFLSLDSNLSPDFSPADYSMVFEAARANSPTRSEYETSDAYHARLKSLSPDTTLYVFALPTGYTSGHTKYNADEGLLELYLDTEGFDAPRVDPNSWRTSYNFLNVISLLKKDEGSSEYVGTNAFGASRRVTAHSEDIRGIVPTNLGGYCGLLKIRMAPEVAQTVSGCSTQLLFLCRLDRVEDWPVAFHTSYYLKATFDQPSSYSFDIDCVTVRVLEIWFTDAGSKRVCGRAFFGG